MSYNNWLGYNSIYTQLNYQQPHNSYVQSMNNYFRSMPQASRLNDMRYELFRNFETNQPMRELNTRLYTMLRY